MGYRNKRPVRKPFKAIEVIYARNKGGSVEVVRSSQILDIF